MNSDPIMISICDESAVMAGPWLASGFECWIVDLTHTAGVHRSGRLVRVGMDVLNFLPPRRVYAFAAAFPPCTDTAVSGARWFTEKGLNALAHAIRVFGRCVELCEWSGAPYCVENPVSVISSHYRKPDHIFNPCDYGDPYTKKTCLWTGGGLRHAS